MRTLRLDVVSDVVCPWCYIGLTALDCALAETEGEVAANVVLHPLQLNPGLPPEGEAAADNLARKYGATPEQARARGAEMRAAAAELGLAMAARPDRLHDTFDAHRLLYWAGAEGRQWALAMALFDARFERGLAVSDPEVLVDAAVAAGLDGDAAREVLARGRYAADVADGEIAWRAEGIASVPTIVVDGEFVIAGAQTPERLARALRRLAAR